MKDRYLGDGVYAHWDGYHIVLDLRAQAPVVPITKIALEPDVLDNFDRFRRDLHDFLVGENRTRV